MTVFSRILLSVSGVLVVTMLPLPSRAASVSFHDLWPMHEAYDAAMYLGEHGIVQGYSDGTFRPDAFVNRAEFAKILEESIPEAILGTELCPLIADGEPIFRDVLAKDDTWYWLYVCMLHARRIIDGYPDGTFRPSEHISFAEAAKIIFGADHLGENGILSVTSAKSDPWYKVYVEYLSMRRAIPPSIRSFDQKITRGEMAEMMYRLRTAETRKPSTTYVDISSATQDEPVVQSHPPSYYGLPEPDTTSEIIQKGTDKFLFNSSIHLSYCNTLLIHDQSLSCDAYRATYAPHVRLMPSDPSAEDIRVDIEYYSQITADHLDALREESKKLPVAVKNIGKSTVYGVYSPMGSYYFWVNKNRTIIVSAEPYCLPSVLENLSTGQVQEGYEIAPQSIPIIIQQCAALDDITAMYVQKLPSDL